MPVSVAARIDVLCVAVASRVAARRHVGMASNVSWSFRYSTIWHPFRMLCVCALLDSGGEASLRPPVPEEQNVGIGSDVIAFRPKGPTVHPARASSALGNDVNAELEA